MTITLTRKERQRRERERQILALARQMLREGGYLGLSMDRIAADMQYSKGTIYLHFPNKEEIILALANEALQQRMNMFEQAAVWPGESRQRMAAIGAAAERFVEKYPQHFAVEQLVRSSSIWEKTSQRRRDHMQHCEARCFHILGGVVRDAISQRDLQLAADQSAEDLAFGLWSLNFGAYTIMTSSDTLVQSGISDPVAALRLSQNQMLDGYQWRVLSSDFDYPALMDRVKRELFDHA